MQKLSSGSKAPPLWLYEEVVILQETKEKSSISLRKGCLSWLPRTFRPDQKEKAEAKPASSDD